MAINTNQYAIDGTAVLIADQSPSGCRIHVHNTDQATPVFLGGDNTVTSSTGYRVDGKDKFEFVLHPNEKLFAICSNGQNAVVAVLRQTQYV